MAHLLLEYVKIADLIRHQIVIPVSDESFRSHPRGNFTTLDNEEREIVDLLTDAQLLEKTPIDVALALAGAIKEQLWLNQRMENRIDLYFPTDDYVLILQGLLRAASRRYSSMEIYEPFAAGVFADLSSLDTSQISIMDIISVRSENAFDDYRRVLRAILQRLQDRQGKFSDLETEFAAAAREEMAECNEKIKQLTKKSNVLRDTVNNLDRVLIGGATGALGGLMAGSPEVAVLGAAAGAAVRPLYDIVRGTWTASPSSAARTSLRHHFLVLDPKHSESRR